MSFVWKGMSLWQGSLWSPIPSTLLSQAAGKKVLCMGNKLSFQAFPTNLVGTLFKTFPSDIFVRGQSGEME